MISRDKRNRLQIAIELAKNLKAKEQIQASASLQENITPLIRRRVEEKLGRKIESDDDQEFYAAMDQEIEKAFDLIVFELTRLQNE
jgi:hypothetical protein